MNLLKGDTNYQRYMIVCRSRVGSNLLVSLLNSHPDAVCYAEIFGDITSGIGGSFQGSTAPAIALREQQPVDYVEQYIYRKYPKGIKAAGFKIFYYHARTDQWEKVWDYFKSIPDLKIIHLKRDNQLKVHLSRKIAAKTNKWMANGAQTAVEDKAVELVKEDCIKDFETTENWQAWVHEFFADHPILDVQYNDLVKDRQATMNKITDFIGLNRATLKSEVRKQNKEHLSDLITNYTTLKKEFEGTRWAGYFEE